MIVLEKWSPKNLFLRYILMVKKEKYFAKRFLIENKNKEEVLSQLIKGLFLS